MKRTDKKLTDKSPGRIDTVTQLNNIHDFLRETQCATSFLGIAATSMNLEEKYSKDVLFGLRICFDMLDERFEKVFDNIQKLTSEVKSL